MMSVAQGVMEDLPDYFARIAQLWLDGDLDALVSFYAYPLPVYSPGSLRIETGAEESRASIAERRRKAITAGTRDIVTRTLSIGQSDDERIPAEVEWIYLDDMARTIGRSEIRYYCRQNPGGAVVIEMIEFLTLAFQSND